MEGLDVGHGAGHSSPGVDTAWRLCVHGEGPEVGHDVGHGHDGVEHGDVDVLADTGPVPVTERGQDPDHLLRPGMSVVPTVRTK